MKYYTLKYKPSLKDGWGGFARHWKIEIAEKYRGDKGLLEHEKFHVREWWYAMFTVFAIAAALFWYVDPGWGLLALLGPLANDGLYRAKWYRKWSETRAYRIQLDKGDYKNTDFAWRNLMSLYGLGLSEKEARKALGL